MPNPAEVASLSFSGTEYQSWEWVEFERRIGSIVSSLRVRVVEMSTITGQTGWSSLRLKPYDQPVTVTLAGRTVMNDGVVTVRQASIDAEQHLIEIIAQSPTMRLPIATPDPPPQFKNSTITQIANALTGPLGITFRLSGNTDGADKTFERFSVHYGETVLQAIDRMARMRNLHLVDDANGNLVGMRGGQATGGTVPVPSAGIGNVSTVAGQLVEGQNIERGNVIITAENAFANLRVWGQNFGNDTHWGDTARDVSATSDNPDGAKSWVNVAEFAEMSGDKGDMKLRADWGVARSLGTMVEAYITVPGWLLPDGGSVWCEHLGESVIIQAPSLFPVDELALAIRGVKHHQSNDNGTVSTIELCLQNALSSGGPYSPGAYPPNSQPAQPDASDD